MSRVGEVDDPSAPTVLVVDNNQMTHMRLKQIFAQRDFNVIQCTDGDKAVDDYIRYEPELVLVSLDIPTLDGHVAALEMREHGGDCRIVFLAPRRLRELAEDASHSAGAVAWLEKPLTDTSLEEKWDAILGPIPDAPGLEDLDELHPMKEDDVIEVSIEEDGMPQINLPPLPLPGLPIQIESEEEIQTPLLLPINPVAKKKKKSKLWWLPVLTIIILVGWQLFASYTYMKYT
ncbi:MAG TPA: response regulator [Candidatus Thalassarchaeaceae archaeon]|jgi:CheY-like chemotaxis protein|nr:response regulator [Candidatus Poseidoniaceae archaeon]MDP7311880.1 response regulator [Candidatus Thalassarchaeaceae archaeon]HJL64868.1 response regulator [Candidatus Thalassarchaeaceae archaeon]